MSANTNLGSTPVNQGYVQLIHTGETGGISGTLRTLYDGDGTASDLQIASNAVKISTQLYIGSKTITEYVQDVVGDMLDTNGSHTNITATYDDNGDGAIDLVATGAISSIIGGTGIDATGSGDITIAIDSTVATLTGTQTLSNKTLASPTFTGTANGANLTLTGDLTVSGDTIFTNSNTVLIGDAILTLNADETGSPTANAGFEVERGTSANKTFIWNETDDKWTIGSETFVASTVEANLTGNVTGNVTGSASLNLLISNNLSDLASASTARSNLGVDAAGTDNSTDVTLAGSLDYITLSGQEITRNAIDLTTDVTGVLPSANLDADTAHLSGTQTFSGAKTFSSTITGNLSGNVTGDVTGNADTATALATAGTLTFTGDVVGGTTPTYTSGGDLSIAMAIQPNSVALGTDTTGNYVGTITAGSGVSTSGASTGEGIAHNLSIDASQTVITSIYNSALQIGSATDEQRIDFGTTDEIRLGSATQTSVKIKTDPLGSAQDEVIIGDGTADVDFVVDGSSGSTIFKVDAGTGNTAVTGDLSISGSFNPATITASTSVRTPLIEFTDGDDAITIENGGGMTFAKGFTVTSGASSFGANVDIKNTGGTILQLNTSSTDVDINGLLGRINFSAPDEFAGSDSNLLAASIAAKATADFTSTSNKTDMILELGVSETASEKFRIVSDGKIKIGGSYTLPSSDGSANQILKTNGSGTVSFADENTGISFNGSTANGLLTYGNSTTADVESNLTFDGTNLDLPDSKKIRLGTSQDLEIYHDGTNSVINNTQTGALQIYNNVDNGMVELLTDNGSGGTQVFLRADGANNMVRMPVDGVKFTLGDASDLQLYHDGTDSIILNQTGDLILRNDEADQDIIFQSDDGAGGVTPYITLNGSATEVDVHKNMRFDDSKLAVFGNGGDMYIYHDGTNNHIRTDAGDMILHQNTDDKDIIFKCDNGSGGVTPYLTLDGGTGHLNLTPPNNVGIGTTSPTEKLEISGGKLLVSGGQIRSGSYLEGFPSFSFANDNDTGMFSDTANQLEFSTGGSSRLTIDSSGNVGIGTTSPQSKLHTVQTLDTVSNTLANGNYGLVVAGDVAGVATDTVGIHLAAKSVPGTPTRGASILAEVQSTNNNHDLIFATSAAVSAPAERMRIDSSGNVGIGTQSPASKLHIRNDSAADQLRLGRVDDDSYLSVGAGATYAVYNMVTGGTIAHQFQEDGDAKMTIQTNGNVGIGTSSPSAKLEISNDVGHAQNTVLVIKSDDPNGDQGASSSADIDFHIWDSNTRLSTPQARIGIRGDGTASQNSEAGGTLSFYTNVASYSSPSLTEALRIDPSQDAHFDQDVIAFSTTPSDIRLKKNFTKIENGLEVVNKLEGHTFNWKKGGDRLSAGFKAQEVEKILPHLVDEKKLPLKADDDKEYKILRYEEMIPYLVEAIKEQQKQINQLEEKLNG